MRSYPFVATFLGAFIAVWPTSSVCQIQAVSPAAPPGLVTAAAPQLWVPQASIIGYLGVVEIKRTGQAAGESINALPVRLLPGDKIRTGQSGSATLQLKDGSKITLGSMSVFTVEEERTEQVTLNLLLGKVWLAVSKFERRRFRVRTPTAVCSVRGTEFSVEALSAARTAVEVFGGMVAVRGALGDEALLSAQQRVDVIEGRLGRLERFEGTMEERQRHEARGEKKEEKREERREQGEDRREGEKLKAALEREVGFQLGREAVESAAAFEMKNALHQEGKTLIDAFGQRVRVEEYITRPNPQTFKFVTLNFRDGRFDRGLFEVTANAALPDDLGSVNLWYSPTPGAIYAVKQRWAMSNGIDSAVEMAVDGASREVTFSSEPIFDPKSNSFLPPAIRTEYVTVFGNIYEFLNGDPAQMNGIWAAAPGGPRPTDGVGMMWHVVPVKMSVNRAADDVSLASYWDYAFLTRTGAAGATGKMFIDHSFAPVPFLARFVERRSYIDFTDNNVSGANGILDFGEDTVPVGADNPFGVAIYHDKAARLNDAGAELAFAGAGLRQAAGDTAFFTDLNRNGVDDQSAATQFLFTGSAGGDFFDLFRFANEKPRDWSMAENFIIDDAGQVFDFRTLFSAGLAAGNEAGTHTNMASIFEKLNFERVLTSNRFEGRKIDVVMTPRLFLKAGLIDTDHNRDSVEAPSK